jgi:hypothetical protein
MAPFWLPPPVPASAPLPPGPTLGGPAPASPEQTAPDELQQQYDKLVGELSAWLQGFAGLGALLVLLGTGYVLSAEELPAGAIGLLVGLVLSTGVWVGLAAAVRQGASWAVVAVIVWEGLLLLSVIIGAFLEMEATHGSPWRHGWMLLLHVTVLTLAGRVANCQAALARRRRWGLDAHAGLAEMVGRRDFASLVGILRGGENDMKRAVILALGGLGSEAAGAVPALIEVVQERLPPEEWETDLCEVCRMELTIWNRHLGAQMCQQCSGRLLLIQEEPERIDPTVSEMAAVALGCVGPAAAPAAPVLRRAARSKDPGLSKAASDALDLIAPQT